MGSGPNTRVEVSVIANSDGSSGIDWSQSFRFIPPSHGNGNGGKINITAPGEAEIIFDLDDRSGLHLQFRPTADEAIWISGDGSCPQSPGNGYGEFTVDRPQNTRLRVTDAHTTTDEYHYMLRFDSRAGLQTFDPIIKN